MKSFWTFKNLADEKGSELRIDGEIVSDDDTWFYDWLDIQHAAPGEFRNALSEHKGKPLTVWIDSWGGDAFAGIGIYNALKEHDGKVTVKIDGKAVSAGSIIAMAGDEILMSPGSIMMIHNASTFAMGESKDMRHVADVLDEVKEGILNVYQTRTSKPRKKISEMMNDETWMSAKTAVNNGFADKIMYSEPDAEPIENAFMFSRLAIQNSVNGSIRKFIDFYQKDKEIEKEVEPIKVVEPSEPVESRKVPVDLYNKYENIIERRSRL